VTKPETRSHYFIGLPSPAAAVVVASIVIAFEDLFATRMNPFIMVMVVYTLAFLMVSNIKYPAFKHFEFKKRVVFSRFLFVILFIYVLATIPRVALFILGITYAVIGPIGLLLANKKQEAASKVTSPPPVNNL
jgi:CDP-diacylglycerol--serine O-phosphatidyltransferase